MDDPARVHFVEQGHLDMFAVALRADEAIGRRRFVARVPAGEFAFGACRISDEPAADSSFGFLVALSQDAVVVEGARSGVTAETFDLATVNWIDEWVSRLSEFQVRDRPPLRGALLLETDPNIPCPAGARLSAQHRDVIRASADAPIHLIGRREFTIAQGAPLLPITQRTWFEIDNDAQVCAVYTPTALVTGRLLPALDRFTAIVLESAIHTEAEAAQASHTRRRDAREARRRSTRSSKLISVSRLARSASSLTSRCWSRIDSRVCSDSSRMACRQPISSRRKYSVCMGPMYSSSPFGT